MTRVGDSIEVAVRAAANGGAMLAHIPGDEMRRTVFVRHALPGERGLARVDAVRSGGRVLFADLLEVVEPGADRVAPPCRFSGPGGCGGCDYQHVNPAAQRALKADVVRDSLQRIGRFAAGDLPWDGQVRAVAGDTEGLRWRTRSRFVVQGGGVAMHRWRSEALIRIDDCLIARRDVVEAATAAAAGAADGVVLAAVSSSTGQVQAGPVPAVARRTVTERIDGREMRVGAAGFWQVHPGAPAALAQAVEQVLAPRPGEALLDLYGGVGLFAAALAPRVAGGRIDVVEGDRAAARLAGANLAGETSCRVHHAPVAQWLRAYRGPADLVVLDPPRTGAGAAVMRDLDRLRPRAVAYVACDPASLARDLRTVVDLGWRMTSLVAFDLFPMTHHIECVAGLAPA